METIQYQKQKTSSGYIKIKIDNIWILEHIFIIENFINRKLTDQEVVHHINSIKTDNRLCNLMIFKSQKEHQKFHNKLKRYGYLTNTMKKQIKERWLNYK